QGGLVIEASATGTIIKGLAIVNSASDGISVASSNNQIIQNNIGLFCDTLSASNGGGGGASANDGINFLPGSSNNTVINNFIGDNYGDGIEVNGNAFSTPQNNLIDNNMIGIDRANLNGGNIGNGILIQNGGNGN